MSRIGIKKVSIGIKENKYRNKKANIGMKENKYKNKRKISIGMKERIR